MGPLATRMDEDELFTDSRLKRRRVDVDASTPDAHAEQALVSNAVWSSGVAFYPPSE